MNSLLCTPLTASTAWLRMHGMIELVYGRGMIGGTMVRPTEMLLDMVRVVEGLSLGKQVRE